MTNHSALIERLEAAASETNYLEDVLGERLNGLGAPLAEAAAALRDQQDRREGVEEDLYQAVLVAYRRGAVEWARLNYPQWAERIKADQVAREIADEPAKRLAADDGHFPWINLSETAKNAYRAKALPSALNQAKEAGE